MPAIYSSTNDGFIQKGLGSWASQRSSASGIADNNNTINKPAGVCRPEDAGMGTIKGEKSLRNLYITLDHINSNIIL